MAEREGGVMSKTKFPYSEQYDEENKRLFKDKVKGLPVTLHCVNCGREVSIGDSYSNRGRNLTCTLCVQQNARESGVREVEYIEKEIWK